MGKFLVFALVPLAVAAVGVVLVMGLTNMARGGSPETSQKLMQWRIALQALALAVIMLTLWVLG
jgi:hypothetical protein